MALLKTNQPAAAPAAKRARAPKTRSGAESLDAAALQAAIHPAWRAALLVWLTTRPLWWGAASLLADPARLSATSAGGPLWMAHQALPLIARYALTELACLLAIHAVWTLARRDGLPQTADRAAWLWAVCPLMVWTLPQSAWGLAACLTLVALSCAQQARFLLALASIGAAAACRPEALVLAPALAWLGWRAYHPGRDAPWAPWALTLGPWAAGALTVLVSLGFGGAFGISLRHLPMTPWGLPTLAACGPVELIMALVACAIGALALRAASTTPGAWWAALLPCLAWPFVHAPMTQATPLWLAAFPAFVYLGKVSEDASVERALLVAMSAASAAALATL